jgi:hypothetical protein
MTRELSFHIPTEARGNVINTGVLLLIVDPVEGTLCYGRHILDNGRGVNGQFSFNGESREPEDPTYLFTLERLLHEELNGNGLKVEVGSLEDHYLGTAWFGETSDVLAHVFWGIADSHEFEAAENDSIGSARDFQFEGFLPVAELLALNLRGRMKEVFETMESVGLSNYLIERGLELKETEQAKPLIGLIEAAGYTIDPEWMDL